MSRILIVGFDFIRNEYPKIPYSIASIIASLQKDKSTNVDYLPIDLKELANLDYPSVTQSCLKVFEDFIAEKFDSYSSIIFGVYAWSYDFTKEIISRLRQDYHGKIILGGYEITAQDDSRLKNDFPDVDFFIKNYAEESLKKVLFGDPKNPIVDSNIVSEELESPYLSETIKIDTPNIYWETKRGCPYSCGFCEWGNASRKKLYRIPKSRLVKELKLFAEKKVKKINILDATFNINYIDIEILKLALSLTKSNIILQSRFENIKGPFGTDFLSLVENNRERITLEFGLQSIHKRELDFIGRKNDISRVQKVLKSLNDRSIQFEVSIIYKIPGQTIETFEQTLCFLRQNGCSNIKAYPLRIPSNSQMNKYLSDLNIVEEKNNFGIKQVVSSYSFTKEDWENVSPKTREPLTGDPFTEYYYDTISCKASSFYILKAELPDTWQITGIENTLDFIFIRGEGEKLHLPNASTLDLKYFIKNEQFTGSLFIYWDSRMIQVKLDFSIYGTGFVYLKN